MIYFFFNFYYLNKKKRKYIIELLIVFYIEQYLCDSRFLFNKQSAAYQQYRQIVEQFRSEINSVKKEPEYQPEDIYEPENATDDEIEHNKHVSTVKL